MNLYVRTAREQVLRVPFGHHTVQYYDVGPMDVPTGRRDRRTGFPQYLSSGDPELPFFPELITRAVSSLPHRHARDIYEARVDLHADAALRDTLAAIKKMFADIEYRLSYRKWKFAQTA